MVVVTEKHLALWSQCADYCQGTRPLAELQRPDGAAEWRSGHWPADDDEPEADQGSELTD